MAKIRCRKNNSRITIEIEGEAKMAHAEKVRQFVISLLSETQHEYMFDLTHVSETDLSFIQLLLSCKKTIESMGKRFLWIPLPEMHPFMNICFRLGIPLQNNFGEGESHGI